MTKMFPFTLGTIFRNMPSEEIQLYMLQILANRYQIRYYLT